MTRCTIAAVLIGSTLIFAFFGIHHVSASSTPLADLAASLPPGTWAELPTTNIAPTLAFTGGASGMTFGFTENGVWDPVSSQFFYIGGDHSPTMPDTCPRFVSYTESTNTWQMLPEPPWFAPKCTPGSAMHGYDHTAIDPLHRKLYHRPFNDMVVRRLDLSSNTWTDLPVIPTTVMANVDCCVGIAWFPERNSLVYASAETGANGSVIEYQESTGQWQRLGSSVPNLPMGPLQQFAEYNPVHKVVVFGGGGGSRNIYKLDSTGHVTTLQPAPFAVGVDASIFTVDPVSGKYLVFDNAKEFWIYDVNQDTWDRQSGTPPIFNSPLYGTPVHGIVATPLDTYGVTMFVKCFSSNCHVFLYKHFSDNVPPTVPITSPAPGSTVSGTITVSANPSDDVGVAGVQFKLDGNNLGTEVTTAPYSVSLDTTTLLNGSHTLTAVARDAAFNRGTSTVTATVSNSIPFNFSLSAVGVQVLTQGQSTSITVTATPLAGSIQPVAFNVSALPSGAGSSFSAASCSPSCSTSLTLSTSTSTPAGQYPITVTGTAGTVSQTVSFTLTVSSLNASLIEKCGQPGNLNCFSFDSSNLYYTWPAGTVCDSSFAGQPNYTFGPNRSGPGNTAAVVQNGQCVFPQFDTTNSHSGAGSLKFTIPSNSSANSSGFFTEPFKRNSDGTFPYIAPGSSFGNVVYFQFYQKFDTNFLSTNFQCAAGTCGGWKQAIWYGSPPNGSSSSTLEVTMVDGYQRGVPQMYGQEGTDDYGVQNVIDCTFAKATSLGGSGSGFISQPNFAPPLNPTCVHYIQNQWMEFTGRIEVRGNPNDAASRVELWVNGQLVIDNPFARINWGSSDGSGLGQFMLTPFHTNKDPNQAHPTGYTWYDDLIISTQPIPMVNGAIPTPDTTPPAISSILVSSITSGAATITWTTNKPADSQILYGPTASYGFATPLNASLLTNHSVTLSGLSPSTTYHFSIRSKDATNNLGISPDITFTTLAPPDTTPPTFSAVAASSITEISATITWTTNEPANSQLEYGLSTSYGSQTGVDTSLVTSHSLTISGLTAATVYNYRLKSADASGNLGTSTNFIFSTAPPQPPPTSGLIGYWPFDEGTGTTTADASGNHNGVLWPNISPLWTTGKVGSALQFNATDNNNYNDDPRVTIGRNFDVSSLPFTISAWVNPVNFADWRVIFSKRDAFLVNQMRFDLGLHTDTGTVYLKQPGSSIDFSYSPATNAWTNLTVVASATDTKLYVNGLVMQTLGAFALGTGSGANTAIGGTGEAIGADPFNGTIDDVRVYNRVLIASEIQDIFFAAGTPFISNVSSSNVTNATATITWTTNKPTDGQVDYGTTSSYGQSTPLNSSLVTAHSVTLSGLSANTTYHWSAKSKDSSGNLVASADYTFLMSNTPSLTLSPTTLNDAVAGVVYNQTVAASGGFAPYTYIIAAGSLPAGLTLNSATGAITGIPTATGTATFTVQATDSAGNVTSRQYSVNTSNVISNNILLTFTNRTWDSATVPGFVGKLTLNFTLTNLGPAITSPMYFQIIQLMKLENLNPNQPNLLLSADNGSGTVGDIQSLVNSSLGTGESTPVSFLIGVGERVTFVFTVDLLTRPSSNPAPMIALNDGLIKGVSAATTDTTNSIGRFQIEVSQASLANSSFPARPSSRTGTTGSSPNGISNIAVISGPGPQSRTAVAVDPTIPMHMAVASNDYASGTVRVATTPDGGVTWYSSAISRTVGNHTFFSAQDPSLAFDSLGHLSVVYAVSNLNDSSNAIVISESSDLINFNPPSAITYHLASDQVIDSRPVVAIKSGVGRYVAWDSLSTTTFRYGINITRSDEGGLFGPITTVISNGRVSSPAIALSNSTIYLGWDDWGFNSISPFKTGGRLQVASSPSGPQISFGSPQTIAQTAIGFGQKIPAMPDAGVGPRLGLAVDPNLDSLLYAVFTDKENGMDIRLAGSADSGTTWAPLTVNNDGTLADQFSPAITVDSGSNVYISFQDTRLSSTFQSADTFLATSSGGNPFDNQRISTASSNDSKSNLTRDITANLGDRTAIAMAANNVVVAWTDTRLASEDVFLSVIAGKQPATPAITWSNPAGITYGTPLGTALLNASASTAGTFDYNPPAGTVLNAGLWTLSVTFTPSDTVDFNKATATVQINVLPAALTFTGASTSRPYGSSNPSFAGFVVGLVNNDNITVAYTTMAALGSPVGDYAIVPVTNDPDKRLSNYALQIFNGVLHVQPAPLMVTAESKSRLYGAQNPPLTGSVVAVVNGDNITVTYATTAVIGSVVGNYPITPSISDPSNRLANYTVTLNNGLLAVQPAPLVVTADSKSRFYGSPNPPLTGSLVGRVNSDNITASYTTAASISSMPGNYPISPAIVDPDRRISNYAVTLSNGVLTVIPAPIITLSTTGVSSSMTSTPGFTAGDTAAASTASLRFGNQNLLSTSSLRLTVGNIGTAPLLIDSVVLGGLNAGDFTKTNNCGATLRVNANCTIDVTFKPLALRNRAALLTLTDNNGGYTGSQQFVSLSGNSVLRYSAYATSSGCGGITLSGKAFIDSFDSISSGLRVTAAAASADIAVNGNVTLRGSAAVKGTIYALNTTVGVCKKGAPIPGITLSDVGKNEREDQREETASMDAFPEDSDHAKGQPRSNRNGDDKKQPAAGYARLTPVAFTTTLPPVTIGASDVKVTGNAIVPALPPGSYRDITVGGKAILTLLPGTYAIKSLKLSGDAKIIIAPSKTASSGPVIINILETNVANPLDLSGGSVTNPSGDPANLFFFYAGTGDISLTGKADSYGVVYAPNAAAKLAGQADWYGALVVKTLESSGRSALHYDLNLAR